MSMKKRFCFIAAESTASYPTSFIISPDGEFLAYANGALSLDGFNQFLITACLCMRKRIPEWKNESYLYHLLGKIS